MKIGLCTITNKDWPLEDVLDAAARTGYDGVELWAKDHIAEQTPEQAAGIAEQASRRDLEIPVYGSYLRAGTKSFEAEFERDLEITESLDANLIRVWAGTQEYEEHSESHWAQVVADLQTVSQAAASRGIEVTVEKHEGSVTNTTAGARELIEAVDEPNCGLNWQPLFFLGAEELRSEARELAGSSNNVHLQAVSEPDGWPRCALSEAYFDVETLLEEFDRVGFDGYVEVEFVAEDAGYEDAIEADLETIQDALP